MRSTLPMTFLFTLLIFIALELSAVLSMNELGRDVAYGWLKYRFASMHIIVVLVSYGTIFALVRILLLLLQHIPELYRKAKEEAENDEE